MAPSFVVILGRLCGCPRGVERASELCGWHAAPSFPTNTRPPACPQWPGARGHCTRVAGSGPVPLSAEVCAGSSRGTEVLGSACRPGPLSAPRSPRQGCAEDSEQLGTVTDSDLFAAM